MVFALLRRRSEKDGTETKQSPKGKWGLKGGAARKGKESKVPEQPLPKPEDDKRAPEVDSPVTDVIENVENKLSDIKEDGTPVDTVKESSSSKENLDDVPNANPAEGGELSPSASKASKSEEKPPDDLSEEKATEGQSELSFEQAASKAAGDDEQQRDVETIEDGNKKDSQQQPWDACCGMLTQLTARD